MKKILAVSVLLASVAAFATPVTSDNTFGVLKISDTTSQQLVISVPWENVGSGGDVKITDLVLPTGLYEGTALYYYDGSNFMAFEIKGGAWADGELDGGLAFNPSQSVARGAALIIKRTKSGKTYPPIYLSGQYAAQTTSTIAAATAEAPAYSLIAPSVANTSEVDLNNYTWTGAARGDAISCGTTTYNYDGSRWYYEEAGTGDSVPVSGGSLFVLPTKVTTEITIPAGQGVWYIRAKGHTTSVTVSW